MADTVVDTVADTVSDNRSGRNMGIELLRAVSMYMVVLMHLLSPILPAEDSFSGVFELTWLLECACYCAVNCYALISGFVAAGRSVTPGKAVLLWLRVAFYSVIFMSLSRVISVPVNPEPVLWGLFPIISGEYWYMTAYFGLMLLMPVLEAGIKRMSVRSMGLICVGVLAVSVTVTYFAPEGKALNVSTIFSLFGGYSVVWLAVLYLAGACLRRSGLLKRVKKWQLALIAVIMALLTWLSRMRGDMRAVSYTSPTVLLEGAALTLLFAKLRIDGRASKRLVSAAARASLGVYLIHINPWLYRAFVSKLSVSFPNFGGAVCIALVLLAGAAVYVVCACIELGRIRLFALLRVQKLAGVVDGLVKRLPGEEK